MKNYRANKMGGNTLSGDGVGREDVGLGREVANQAKFILLSPLILCSIITTITTIQSLLDFHVREENVSHHQCFCNKGGKMHFRKRTLSQQMQFG